MWNLWLFACVCAASTLEVEVDAQGHAYLVAVDGQTWFRSADTCVHANSRQYCSQDGSLSLINQSTYSAQDAFGPMSVVALTWAVGNTSQQYQTLFRTYDGFIVFEQVFLTGLSNTNVSNQDQLSSSFPSFMVEDSSEINKAFLNWGGPMVGREAVIGQWASGPQAFHSGLEAGPIVVFTNLSGIVISPASSFMSMSQVYNSTSNTLSWGLMGHLTSIPANYRAETILSLGSGVNAAMNTWGDILLKRFGKSREAARADFTTNYLGYSTDNGAYYYYHTEPKLTYQDTILAVKAYADSVKLPYKHWLMDSWWYYQGDGGGVTNWTARPDIFPGGTAAVTAQTKWGIVAHNRFWADNNVYATQNGGDYQFIIERQSSGGLAIPVEQRFWDDLIRNATVWGLRVYEQDWLYNEFSELNCTLESASLARQWLMQMGNACEKEGINIQYCMSWPRHILQSLEIPAVTQARASDDYQQNANQQWKLGITSIFAHAVGITPTKDNFWSTSDQPGNTHYGNNTEPYSSLHAAVSTFSTGPVAPSDQIGKSDVALIMRSCSSSGRLLQPDRPATWTDAGILRAAGVSTGPLGEVWTTETNLTGAVYHYVISVETPFQSITLADIGGDAKVNYVMWEHRNSSNFDFVDPSHDFIELAPTSMSNFTVHTLAPTLYNGWTLLGEANTKWVAVSNDRFSDLNIQPDSLSVDITGAPSEQVEILFLAPKTAEIVKVECAIGQSGKMRIQVPGSQCTPY